MTTSRADYEAQLLAEAKKLFGVPFLHNGRSPSQGFDCLGLVVYLQRVAGCADFPDTEKFYPANWHVHATRELYLEGVAKVCQMLPPGHPVRAGDCPMFRLGRLYPNTGSQRVQHVGVVLSVQPGRTRFLQTIAGRGVMESTLEDRAWRTCYVTAARAYALKAYLGEG